MPDRALWCVLDLASVPVFCFLVDRTTEPLMVAYHAEHGTWPVGYFDDERGEILIERSLRPLIAEATLVHELGHAVITFYGLSESLIRSYTSAKEEALVLPLFAALFDALVRNALLLIPPRPELSEGPAAPPG
jgi:hypothetical protein